MVAFAGVGSMRAVGSDSTGSPPGRSGPALGAGRTKTVTALCYPLAESSPRAVVTVGPTATGPGPPGRPGGPNRLIGGAVHAQREGQVEVDVLRHGLQKLVRPVHGAPAKAPEAP
ncbi:hypothetical protein GCM10010495_68860 [Kitasatospora herbaricolor]|nr:hypothetical protein GCM10010495_68860 [Kitasatospora herbaricolor]